MTSTLNQTTTPVSNDVSAPRTSEVLRGLLGNNPGVTTFSVEAILASIGVERVEASLLMFSIPAIVPISTETGTVAAPTGALGYQLLFNQKRIRLPGFILRQTVSRRALAVAIHAILPILEAAEKVARPRWKWVNHPAARRAIGLFVFVLALAIACPLFGFNPLHATSIFVMALGMAEQDGIAVLIGVAVGVLSLAMVAASGLSGRPLLANAAKWLRKVGRKLGLEALANALRRRGHEALARVVTFQWSDLLLVWDPEKRAAARARRRAAAVRAARERTPLALASASNPLAGASASSAVHSSLLAPVGI